ncbi:helix-turn-helix domain-containing protein [Halocynthiibacter namhaensis]|uniref:helix-turn-helix domain-containing protein n=1 Tax=Halocynthiibacter namhaensis TaxID=1290553 RepID=UPI000578F13D|nr:helix-turn-helix domain-containing protein [Halocynthiibacter namhaensis]
MIGRFRSPVQVEPEGPKGFDDFVVRLGDMMRGERATLGKSLLDVQRELKIKASYVAAIENADPSAFETPGFIAGYVRSYARYLGMDPDEAFSIFCAESGFETAHGMSSNASTLKNNRKAMTPVVASSDPFADPNAKFIPQDNHRFSAVQPGALGSLAVLIALTGAIGFGVWTVLKEIQRVDIAQEISSEIITDDLQLTGHDPLARRESGDIVVAAIAASDAAAFERLYRPEALEVPVLVSRDGPIGTLDPSTTGAFAPTQFANDAAVDLPLRVAAAGYLEGETEVQVTAETAPELRLVAVRASWVRVRGAGGAILFEKIMNAGDEYIPPQTEEPATLKAGESGAVYFAMGDKMYGPVGPRGQVTSEVVLSAASVSETYEIADLDADQDLARVVAEALPE